MSGLHRSERRVRDHSHTDGLSPLPESVLAYEPLLLCTQPADITYVDRSAPYMRLLEASTVEVPHVCHAAS